MISRRRALAHLSALAATPAALAETRLVAVAGQNTMVRWLTTQGPIDLQLFDSAAPLTVANFLGYLNKGAYLGAMVHRSVPGFIIQTGGYTWVDTTVGIKKVAAGPAVANEFSATRSNLRGTIAMAKLGGNPNSATCEWFVNLANNAANLDEQNGGFTVFGRVTTSGMVVADKIAALKVVDAGGVYTNLPVVNHTSGNVGINQVVRATAVSVLPGAGTASESDRIFNYLEGTYPQYVPVAGSSGGTGQGYYYRYYPGTNSYVGTREGDVFYLVPSISPDVQPLASMATLLAQAAAEGY
jgi:peptidyl-prolyl cis-trans isomerase A (cyclophilin A)